MTDLFYITVSLYEDGRLVRFKIVEPPHQLTLKELEKMKK